MTGHHMLRAFEQGGAGAPDELVADVARPDRAVLAAARARGRPELAATRCCGPCRPGQERLAERDAAETDIRVRLGLPSPPVGRPKRARPRAAASVRGHRLADYPNLLLEWAWASLRSS